MADLEQRLCEAIEPVLKRWGVPAVFNEPSPGADRGDMTSDIARAAIEVVHRFLSEPAGPGGVVASRVEGGG